MRTEFVAISSFTILENSRKIFPFHCHTRLINISLFAKLNLFLIYWQYIVHFLISFNLFDLSFTLSPPTTPTDYMQYANLDFNLLPYPLEMYHLSCGFNRKLSFQICKAAGLRCQKHSVYSFC